MLVKIIALAIGIVLAIAGIAFFIKEKDDPESRKIYLVTMIIGIVLAVGAAVMLAM